MKHHQLSIKSYPFYKDSGVEWLGDVPEHWGIYRAKDTVKRIGNGVTPRGGSEVYTDSGIPLLRSQNVYDDGLRIENVSFVPMKIHDEMKSSQLKASDILINITGASIGRTCIVPIDFGAANINQHIAFLRIKNWFNSSYISLFLKSYFIKNYIRIEQNGASKEAFNLNQIANIPLVLPPLSEQKAIALYLDNKTAQIDRKIDLLTQKAKSYADLKRSLINETVTRGRDRSVPMKDSAIEWIGEVPEHWEIKHLKSLAEIKGGKDSKEVELEEGEYPIYGSGGIFGRASKYLHEKPSVLLGRKGTIDKPLFVTKPFWSVDTMFYTEIKNGIYPKFFYYQCLTIQFGLYQYGSAVPSMAQNVLRQILFATPPLSEQKEIATYLDTKTAQIDQIIQTINTQIEKLKELRKTLINDVVTGKIKVTED